MMHYRSKTGVAFKIAVSILMIGMVSLACTDIGIGPDDVIVKMQGSVEPAGSGSVNPPFGSYKLGKEITIEAVDSNPGDSLQFLGWKGDTTAAVNPLTFTISRDMNITARFGKPSYVLTTSVKPSGKGSISPSSGTFELNTKVNIEAQAADGYYFERWEGDTTSTKNPLTVIFKRDMDLQAVFKEVVAQPFANFITVSNSQDLSTSLTFGMKENATSGFDSGLDRDLPPAPIPPAFDARFTIPEFGLAEDYRSVQPGETVWKLEVQSAEQDTVYLDWDFSQSNHMGSLILTDDPANPGFEIDMKSKASYSSSGKVETNLYIISNR